MTKKIVLSSIIALGIDVLGLLVNLICALTIKSIPLAKTISGGEYIGHVGFGILFEEIFAFDVDSGTTTTNISFSFVNFLLTFVVLFVIVFVISVIISKIKSKK